MMKSRAWGAVSDHSASVDDYRTVHGLVSLGNIVSDQEDRHSLERLLMQEPP